MKAGAAGGSQCSAVQYFLLITDVENRNRKQDVCNDCFHQIDNPGLCIKVKLPEPDVISLTVKS